MRCIAFGGAAAKDRSVVLRLDHGEGVELETSYQKTDDPVWTRLTFRRWQEVGVLDITAESPGFADETGIVDEESNQRQVSFWLG